MAKKKQTSKKKVTKEPVESDGSYFLKLVLYIIVGSQWLWINSGDGLSQTPLPIGLVVGLWFASHERFQLDRKIEYAILLVAMLIGFWVQVGIFIN